MRIDIDQGRDYITATITGQDEQPSLKDVMTCLYRAMTGFCRLTSLMQEADGEEIKTPFENLIELAVGLGDKETRGYTVETDWVEETKTFMLYLQLVPIPETQTAVETRQ